MSILWTLLLVYIGSCIGCYITLATINARSFKGEPIISLVRGFIGCLVWPLLLYLLYPMWRDEVYHLNKAERELLHSALLDHGRAINYEKKHLYFKNKPAAIVNRNLYMRIK